MNTRICNLEKETAIWKAKAETWEKAFKILTRSFSEEKPEEVNIYQEEQEAVDFINQKILTQLPKEGELQAEGLWDGIVKVLVDQIKQRAIAYAGKALEHFKDQVAERGIEQAVNLAGFALEKLQDYLFERYQSSDEKQKEIFKDKILEKFPDSGLASKLRNY